MNWIKLERIKGRGRTTALRSATFGAENHLPRESKLRGKKMDMLPTALKKGFWVRKKASAAAEPLAGMRGRENMAAYCGKTKNRGI